MKSRAAIKAIINCVNEEDVAIFTTGYISRHAYSLKDRKGNFYTIGSMGLVSSIGLGMALNCPRKVFIFDGDGSLLMDMGTMAMVGHHRPRNLYHILLDNGSYASTGCQPTIARSADFVRLARAAGYKSAIEIADQGSLNSQVNKIVNATGPILVHLRTEDKGDIDVGRVKLSPESMARRIKEITVRAHS